MTGSFFQNILLQSQLVEVLFSAFDDYTGSQFVGSVALGYIRDLLIVHGNAALLDIAAGVRL